ncbi:hypothetical protein QJS66_15625 [Kocuria rhizophila]|nr:hypothetical protein QJS66_15625 [Kocuria rhizophila]
MATGAECSAASLGILVGSVATSDGSPPARGRRLLHGGGLAGEPATTVGPRRGAALGQAPARAHQAGARRGVAHEPKQLDDSGRLSRPGLRTGVKPRILLPPHRVLRPRPGAHVRGQPRGGRGAAERHGLRAPPRASTPLDADEILRWVNFTCRPATST